MTINFKILDKTKIKIDCIYCDQSQKGFYINSVKHYMNPNKVEIEFYCNGCDKITIIAITDSEIFIKGGYIDNDSVCCKDQKNKDREKLIKKIYLFNID